MDKYYMGLDVSKGYADIIILDSEKKIVEESFQLDDTSAGHRELKTRLEIFFKNHPESEVYSAVESTGGYENNWYNLLSVLLEEMEVYVARINPLGVSHHAKAKMDRIVTDKSAAKNIAEYQINHPEKTEYSKKQYFPELRSQWKYVRMIKKQKTQLLNQLESLVYRANPEMLSDCRHGVPEWLLNVLKRYPTAKKLAAAKVSVLTNIPYVSTEKAKALISRAKKTVASSENEITANLITSIIAQIQAREEESKTHMRYIEKKCELPAEVEILKSFPGIATYSAVGLMLEIGTIERFTDAKHLASFFGLHPVYKTSGDGKRGVHMSKQGRTEPRAILYMVAWSSITCNPQIKEIYKKHRKAGMCFRAAIGVCMHKILRIVFGMLKNNEKYNPEKEKEIREKATTEKRPTVVTKLRRFQALDESAPISGRQSKKRKEQEKSQNEIISLNAGSFPCS